MGGVLGTDGGLAAAARAPGLGEAPRGGLCLPVAWTNCLPTHQHCLNNIVMVIYNMVINKFQGVLTTDTASIRYFVVDNAS